MSLGQLVDKVMEVLGMDVDGAMKVAQELYVPNREDYSEDVIRYAADKLGVTLEPETEPEPATPVPHMTMDPAEVLRQVYLACPRCVPADGEGNVHVPVIGRAPIDEEYEIPAELLDSLPEHVRVLVMDVNVMNGEVSLVLYDEANGVDRRMPPIDLTVYDTPEKFHGAIDTLLGRLPRILASDSN